MIRLLASGVVVLLMAVGGCGSRPPAPPAAATETAREQPELRWQPPVVLDFPLQPAPRQKPHVIRARGPKMLFLIGGRAPGTTPDEDSLWCMASEDGGYTFAPRWHIEAVDQFWIEPSERRWIVTAHHKKKLLSIHRLHPGTLETEAPPFQIAIPAPPDAAAVFPKVWTVRGEGRTFLFLQSNCSPREFISISTDEGKTWSDLGELEENWQMYKEGVFFKGKFYISPWGQRDGTAPAVLTTTDGLSWSREELQIAPNAGQLISSVFVHQDALGILLRSQHEFRLARARDGLRFDDMQRIEIHDRQYVWGNLTRYIEPVTIRGQVRNLSQAMASVTDGFTLALDPRDRWQVNVLSMTQDEQTGDVLAILGLTRGVLAQGRMSGMMSVAGPLLLRRFGPPVPFPSPPEAFRTRVRELVTLLGDEDPQARDLAQNTLEGMGPRILHTLEELPPSDDPEIDSRLKAIRSRWILSGPWWKGN